jgi:hypothetical protein
VPEGRACTSDSECFVLHVYTCCGPDLAVGLAKNAPQYAACYHQAIGPNACGGLGCAKQLATTTEDGNSTADGGTPAVRCVASASGGQCTTQIAPPQGSLERRREHARVSTRNAYRGIDVFFVADRLLLLRELNLLLRPAGRNRRTVCVGLRNGTGRGLPRDRAHPRWVVQQSWTALQLRLSRLRSE